MFMTVNVLFVCLGNICRSPTADGIFRQRVAAAGMQQRIGVDSAGTADWHQGRAPDARTLAAAAKRGYDLSSLRARQVIAGDFQEFDYVLAMDKSNLSHLRRLAPADYPGHLGLFLDFAPHLGLREVPDPYYGGTEGFEQVLDLVEQASDELLNHIRQNHF
jgi:protein-tyrosine phosphatase